MVIFSNHNMRKRIQLSGKEILHTTRSEKRNIQRKDIYSFHLNSSDGCEYLDDDMRIRDQPYSGSRVKNNEYTMMEAE